MQKFFRSGSLLSLCSKEIIVGWGKRTWANEPKPSAYNWYFPDFFLKAPSPFFTHEYVEVISREKLIEAFDNIATEYQWEKINWEVFDESYAELQSLFTKGILQKAVPYVVESTKGKITPRKIEGMLRCALTKVPLSSAIYGFWDEESGILGVTPELLFRMEDNTTIETMACAGTSKTADCFDMINDPKLRHEHELVIKGISEALQPYGQLLTGLPEVCAFGEVSHLVTPLRLVAKEPLQFQALVKSLHPTPALGTFPKEGSMQWLSDYEKKCPRNRYGAPFGIIRDDQVLLYVAIRNLQWEKETIKLFAGCGVVKESSLEAEKQEVIAKLKSIKELFGV